MDQNSAANTLDVLANNIYTTNTFFLQQAYKKVNTAMTLRNWLFGFYIVEYEQAGKDRADYGTKLYKVVAQRLANTGLKSVRERHLYHCKDFYKTYPQILRTPSAKFYLGDARLETILRTPSATSKPVGDTEHINTLLTSLSFSHFIELLKPENETMRRFYEIQALTNNWGYGN